MAQLLNHQDSAFYGKEMQGHRWSFLQFFGLRRRPRSLKMLSDKKNGQEKGTGGSRLRGCYVPLKEEDNGVTDDHENTQVTDKQKGSRKKSGKAGLRSFISRKLYGKKEGQKEKMLPVAPRLLRTLSIHYLQSNVYVFDDQSAGKGDGSSHGAKSSLQNATGTNLQQNSLDGSSNETSFSQLVGGGEKPANRKSHRSISMDGILHKVPYGKIVSGETILEELPRSASATYDRDGLKPYNAKRNLNHGFGRSRSLSESLESYSQLLDSISSSEAKRVLTSSKSTRNYSLESKGMTRLTENLVIPEVASVSHAPDKIALDGDVMFAVDESSCTDEVVGASENLVLLQDYVSDKRRDVEASTQAGICIAPVTSEDVDVSEEDAAAASDYDQVISSTEINDIPEEQARTCDDDPIQSSTEPDSCPLLTTVQSEDVDIAEQHASPSGDETQSCTTEPSQEIGIAEEEAMISNQIQSFKGTCCVSDTDQYTEDELDLSCEQETESPTSVLDVAFSDHHASSEYHRIQDDSSSLEGVTVHSNEADDSIGDVNDLQADDLKNEGVSNYVKDIFNKSSFATEPLFDAWRSQNMATLHREECQHNDLNFSGAPTSNLAITDMCADELLLFDLTNEALLDMYRKYDAARSRSKPVGQNALRELWSRVSSQLLDEQPPPAGVDVDSLLVSDMAKADRWMEFRGHGDEVGSEVADFVLDRLVTDLARQLVKF